MAAHNITSMALFCDFENVALGVRDAQYAKFDIDRVLERLLLKGSIVVKKAYCASRTPSATFSKSQNSAMLVML